MCEIFFPDCTPGDPPTGLFTLPEFDPKRPIFANLGRRWPRLAGVGRGWPRLADVGHDLPEFGAFRTNFVRL